MNLTMLSNDTTATFEVGSDEFALSSAASSGRVIGRALSFTVSEGQSTVSLSIAPKVLENEAQTERLNRALALGYMPALRKTTIR
jgi:hypothetical protein